MTNTKLFDKLRSLMAKTERADKKHIKKLRKVLHKLKDRQRELQEKLEKSESPQEQAKIQQEIDIIKLQRGKGAEVYQRVKQERQARKEGKGKDS